MNDKKTNTTKADLLKMLAEAVRNTPGATQLDPILDTQPDLLKDHRGSAKREAKIKRRPASPGRKRRHRR